jgi:outer membrane protein assembly factor BamB
MYNYDNSRYIYLSTIKKHWILLIAIATALTGCGILSQKVQIPSKIPEKLTLYIQESLSSRYSNSIVALQAINGKEKWHYTIKSGYQVLHVLTTSTAVYLITSSIPPANTSSFSPAFVLIAINPFDGKPIWQRTITSGSVLPEPQVVYVGILDSTGHKTIAALHANNGIIIWHTPITGVPSFFQLAQGNVYAIVGHKTDTGLIDPLYSGSLLAMDAKNGNILWQYHPAGGIASVYINRGIAYTTTILYQGNTSYRSLYALNATDGDILWQHRGSLSVYPFVESYKGTIISIDGNSSLSALNIANGSILWKYISNQFLIGFTKQRDILYFGQEKHVTVPSVARLQALQISNGHVLWEHVFMGDTKLAPNLLVDDNSLYVGIQTPNNTKIYALQISNGAVRWSYGQSHSSISSFQIQHGVIYISSWKGSKSGSVCALQAATGDTIWCQALGARPEVATLG